MRKILIFFSCFLYIGQIVSQEVDASIQFALNRKIPSLSSDYEIDQSLQAKGILGGNLGANLNIRLSKFSIRNYIGIQIAYYKFESDASYKDVNGNDIGNFDRQLRNIEFQYAPILSYDFENGVFLGTGTTLSFLLNSQYKNQKLTINGVSSEDINWFNNNQYRNFAFDIPFIVGYEWNKNSIFLNFTLGISNRNNSESLIKERHNSIIIGYNLSISNN